MLPVPLASLFSEVVVRTIADLKRLPDFDLGGGVLRYTLERLPSLTEIGHGDIQQQLGQVTAAAYAQVITVRSMLSGIVRAAET